MDACHGGQHRGLCRELRVQLHGKRALHVPRQAKRQARSMVRAVPRHQLSITNGIVSMLYLYWNTQIVGPNTHVCHLRARQFHIG